MQGRGREDRYIKIRKEWYNKQYDKNNTKKEKYIHKIHYWLNNIK